MKTLAAILMTLCVHTAFTQNLPDYSSIALVQKTDYAIAEPSVMQAVNYVLTTPYSQNDLNRLKCIQFIIKWMGGTPDFSFTLDDTAVNIAKGNNDLLGIYMACMTKYCLENKSLAKDVQLVKLNSIKLLLAYCENPNNNIKMTKQLKKLSQANHKGILEKEM